MKRSGGENTENRSACHAWFGNHHKERGERTALTASQRALQQRARHVVLPARNGM